jgi:hypothetical protein
MTGYRICFDSDIFNPKQVLNSLGIRIKRENIELCKIKTIGFQFDYTSTFSYIPIYHLVIKLKGSDKLVEIDKSTDYTYLEELKEYLSDESIGEKKWKMKTKTEKIKELKTKLKDTISKFEKHGVIILDIKAVNEEMISRALNPTKEQEIEILKEECEIKIKSAKIDERNKVCEELQEQIMKVVDEIFNSNEKNRQTN